MKSASFTVTVTEEDLKRLGDMNITDKEIEALDFDELISIMEENYQETFFADELAEATESMLGDLDVEDDDEEDVPSYSTACRQPISWNDTEEKSDGES